MLMRSYQLSKRSNWTHWLLGGLSFESRPRSGSDVDENGRTSSLIDWYPNTQLSFPKPFRIPSPGTELESGLRRDMYLSVNQSENLTVVIDKRLSTLNITGRQMFDWLKHVLLYFVFIWINCVLEILRDLTKNHWPNYYLEQRRFKILRA